MIGFAAGVEEREGESILDENQDETEARARSHAFEFGSCLRWFAPNHPY